jgi:UrcA family protein
MSVRVSIAGLDISSPAGAKAVLGRIHQAARSICGAEPVVQDLSGRAAYSRCVSAITDRTVAALANPVVTAMNGGQSVVEVASTGR